MFTMHLPPRLGQITHSFAQTETAAWFVLLVAVGTFGLIAAYLFN